MTPLPGIRASLARAALKGIGFCLGAWTESLRVREYETVTPDGQGLICQEVRLWVRYEARVKIWLMIRGWSWGQE